MPANISAQTDDGQTPLSFATTAHRIDAVAFLLSAGANPNPASEHGSSLYIACVSGDERMVDLLLRSGADIEARTGFGYTPLIGACASLSHGIVIKLLAAGADINASDIHGATALMEAAERGDQDLAKLLLQNGADPDRLNEFGKSARMLAEQCCNWDIAAILTVAEKHSHVSARPAQPIM